MEEGKFSLPLYVVVHTTDVPCIDKKSIIEDSVGANSQFSCMTLLGQDKI